MIETRLATLALAALAASTLGGCGIYVGNIRFTAVEVCSEEYASRLHPNSGCLPPTRAENAQSFFLARYRLPVPSSEAAAITAGSKPPSNDSSTKADPNQLPSFIGRIFKAEAESQSDRTITWRAPSTGNIEFISVLDEKGSTHRKLATDVLVNTDLAGVVQTKLSLGAELNPAAIVSAALVASGLPATAAPSGLQEALSQQVLSAGFGRTGFNAAKGRYYYVSLGAEQLDSLMSALAICNWSVDQDPSKQKSGRAGTSGASAAAYSPPIETCAETLAKSRTKFSGTSTLELIQQIEATRADRGDLKVVGLVIGVALLHTDSGTSEICNQADLGLIMQGKTGALSNPSCDSLRALLDKYMKTGAIEPGPNSGPAAKTASTLSADQAKTLIVSLSAEYARASYKILQLHSHTSVLALHWIPVQIRNRR